MAALTTTTASAALKTYYSAQRMQNLTYKDMPLYAMLTKHKDFFGSSYPLPMRVVNPQGRSATFTSAQGGKVGSNYKTFSLTRVNDYALASIATEAMLASESDAGAFLKLATAEIDGSIESLKRSLGWSVYGTSGGTIGQVLATLTSGTTVSLVNVEDISKFEVGQILNVYSAATAGTQRTSNGSLTDFTILTVNRDAGTFTVSVTFNGSSTVVANDYIVVKGDYDAKMSGLASWIPSSAPSATAFFGVDRTIDSTRLGGIRVTSTGKPQDEAIVDAARRCGREGASPDMLFTGFTKYASLEKLLGSRVRYVDIEVAGFGFRGIEVSGPKGTITVLPDRDCPASLQYMLSMENWGLYSLKEPVMLLNQDGNNLLRESTADALEVRVGGYFQLGCDNPGNSAVLVY